MRIGVVSDTHVPGRARTLPTALLDGLQGVDMILHAGDITAPAVLDQLAELAPVIAVAGNNDPPAVAAALGYQRVVEVAHGRRIGLVHGHLGRGRSTPLRALAAFRGQAVDCVVFGHSHLPYHQIHDGVLVFNPGSPTDRRRASSYSYGLITVTPEGLQAELRSLIHPRV